MKTFLLNTYNAIMSCHCCVTITGYLWNSVDVFQTIVICQTTIWHYVHVLAYLMQIVSFEWTMQSSILAFFANKLQCDKCCIYRLWCNSAFDFPLWAIRSDCDINKAVIVVVLHALLKLISEIFASKSKCGNVAC